MSQTSLPLILVSLNDGKRCPTLSFSCWSESPTLPMCITLSPSRTLIGVFTHFVSSGVELSSACSSRVELSLFVVTASLYYCPQCLRQPYHLQEVCSREFGGSLPLIPKYVSFHSCVGYVNFSNDLGFHTDPLSKLTWPSLLLCLFIIYGNYARRHRWWFIFQSELVCLALVNGDPP